MFIAAIIESDVFAR